MNQILIIFLLFVISSGNIFAERMDSIPGSDVIKGMVINKALKKYKAGDDSDFRGLVDTFTKKQIYDIYEVIPQNLTIDYIDRVARNYYDNPVTVPPSDLINGQYELINIANPLAYYRYFQSLFNYDPLAPMKFGNLPDIQLDLRSGRKCTINVDARKNIAGKLYRGTKADNSGSKCLSYDTYGLWQALYTLLINDIREDNFKSRVIVYTDEQDPVQLTNYFDLWEMLELKGFNISAVIRLELTDVHDFWINETGSMNDNSWKEVKTPIYFATNLPYVDKKGEKKSLVVPGTHSELVLNITYDYDNNGVIDNYDYNARVAYYYSVEENGRPKGTGDMFAFLFMREDTVNASWVPRVKLFETAQQQEINQMLHWMYDFAVQSQKIALRLKVPNLKEVKKAVKNVGSFGILGTCNDGVSFIIQKLGLKQRGFPFARNSEFDKYYPAEIGEVLSQIPSDTDPVVNQESLKERIKFIRENFAPNALPNWIRYFDTVRDQVGI